MLNSRHVELLDHPRLIAQLCGLQRRTARGGRDSIDHAPGARDDVCNAAAGALIAVARRADWTTLDFDGDDPEPRRLNGYQQQLAQAFPFIFEKPDGLTCGMCANRSEQRGEPFCTQQRLFVRNSDLACDHFDLRTQPPA